jgi:hypothetical protein
VAGLAFSAIERGLDRTVARTWIEGLELDGYGVHTGIRRTPVHSVAFRYRDHGWPVDREVLSDPAFRWRELLGALVDHAQPDPVDGAFTQRRLPFEPLDGRLRRRPRPAEACRGRFA